MIFLSLDVGRGCSAVSCDESSVQLVVRVSKQEAVRDVDDHITTRQTNYETNVGLVTHTLSWPLVHILISLHTAYEHPFVVYVDKQAACIAHQRLPFVPTSFFCLSSSP